MFIYARLDGAQLDVVHAHHVLKIAVARQPRYDRGRGRHLAGLDVRRPQRQLLLLADDHRAGRVPRRPPVGRHRPHADPVRLRTGRKKKKRLQRTYVLLIITSSRGRTVAVVLSRRRRTCDSVRVSDGSVHELVGRRFVSRDYFLNVSCHRVCAIGTPARALVKKKK